MGNASRSFGARRQFSVGSRQGIAFAWDSATELSADGRQLRRLRCCRVAVFALNLSDFDLCAHRCRANMSSPETATPANGLDHASCGSSMPSSRSNGLSENSSATRAAEIRVQVSNHRQSVSLSASTSTACTCTSPFCPCIRECDCH